MHIVTVMDYDDPNGVAMCKAWFYFMFRYNPDAEVTVFYGDRAGKIVDFAKRLSGVQLVQLDLDGIYPYYEMRGRTTPSQDLMLAFWKHVEICDIGDFIMVEADAWTLGSLDMLWNVRKDKPYIAVYEKELGGKPAINTGVYSYSSDGFLSYTKLVHQYMRDGEIKYALGDQWLTNAYFRRIGYDASHWAIGYEHNCWALNARVVRADDDGVEVRSGEKPNIPEDPQWYGWGKNVQARIIHAYWRKYWELPEMKSLWDYALEKVRTWPTTT